MSARRGVTRPQMDVGPSAPDDVDTLVEEAPRGEIVFVLAKGVAFVVGLAACLFLSVLAVISNAVITNTAEKSGLVPMSVGVIAVALLIAKQLSLPLSTVAKIFLRSC